MGEDRDEGFLGRWSRLKRERATDGELRGQPESGTEAPAEAISGAAPAPAAVDTPPEGHADEDGTPVDLPPIESLGRDSDFTVFMKEGVPEEIRQQALRKLWLTDPVLANLDGLVEYGEDFSEPWRTTSVVKTLYRIGKGMPGGLEDIAEELAGESDTPEAARLHEPPQSPPAEGSTEASDANDAVAEALPGEPSQDDPVDPVPAKPVKDA